MGRTIWEKMIVESVTLNEEKVKYINIGYFLANKEGKKYVVGIYRTFPLIESQEDIGSFENLYVVYDIEKDLVYDEFENKDEEIFKYLPQIDSVQFDNNYEDDEVIEKSKREIKDSIEEYLAQGKLADKYFDALLKIYGIVDKSSKSFYEFFIKEIKNI